MAKAKYCQILTSALKGVVIVSAEAQEINYTYSGKWIRYLRANFLMNNTQCRIYQRPIHLNLQCLHSCFLSRFNISVSIADKP
jgi:hypothetical protein